MIQRGQAIIALIVKDLALFFRNRFFAFITFLSLAVFIALYFFLPTAVDETFEIGIYAPADLLEKIQSASEEGITWLSLNSDAEVRQAVLEERVVAGLALPGDFLAALVANKRPTVNLYLKATAPPEIQQTAQVLVEGLSLALSGPSLPLEAHVEILGANPEEESIPPRNQLRTLFAIVVLTMEIFGMASLLAEEISTGTIRALLTTPLRTVDLFAAKSITSVLMSFGQGVLLMGAMGGLARQSAFVLLGLLLGALMATGIGFLLAAGGKDMLSVSAIGTLVLILLSLPPLGVISPGLFTGWIQAIPSYHLANILHQASNLGAGWAQLWQPILILLGFDLALWGAGVAVLKRRFS